MKQYKNSSSRLGQLSGLLLAGFLAFNSFSATNVAHADKSDKSAGVTIAVLDEGALSDKFTKYQEAMKAIDQRAQQLDEQLKARDLFNSEEGTRFDTLIVKPDLSADEQKELDTLLKTGNDRRAELLSLSGKATRTDTENARIKELQALLKSNSDARQKLQETLLKTLLDQKHSTEEKYIGMANDAVAQIAKDKNLTLVLSKNAVVWNSPTIDITDEVVKQLNKTK